MDENTVRAASVDRGELVLVLDGTRMGLRPTFEAIEAIEQQLGRGLVDVARDALADKLTIRAASTDMGDGIEEAAVRGFRSLEDEGARAAGSAVTNLLKIRGVAGTVIGGIVADLARLAIQKAIVKAIGGSFLGFADGGALADIPGFANGGLPGGLLSGPGTGRSDSILAMLSNGRGAIRVSNGEFIMNEAATSYYGAETMAALNARRLPKFANGGSIGRAPGLPSLRSPRLPAPGRSASAGLGRLQLDGQIGIKPSPLFQAEMESMTIRTVGAAAEPIMAGAENRTIRRINRETLPGGWGG